MVVKNYLKKGDAWWQSQSMTQTQQNVREQNGMGSCHTCLELMYFFFHFNCLCSYDVIQNNVTHEVLCKYRRIKSIALWEKLGGFLLPQICSHDKELSIQSCFSRLLYCRGTQRNLTDPKVVEWQWWCVIHAWHSQLSLHEYENKICCGRIGQLELQLEEGAKYTPASHPYINQDATQSLASCKTAEPAA